MNSLSTQHSPTPLQLAIERTFTNDVSLLDYVDAYITASPTSTSHTSVFCYGLPVSAHPLETCKYDDKGNNMSLKVSYSFVNSEMQTWL